MSEEKKVLKIEHKNIFAALAAFQGENPEIKRTKNVQFEAKGKTVSFWYAPLDEILQTIRPLTSKHGISVTWEQDKDGKMVCALYHETYDKDVVKQTEIPLEGGGGSKIMFNLTEKNVIRSIPITVRRAGDMKDIGTDSTYARRYTLAEVLGIASDEDNDIEVEEARRGNVEKFALKQAKEKVKTAKTLEQVAEQAKFFQDELTLISTGKAPKLGFSEDQYNELIESCMARQVEIKSKVEDKGVEK